jgi:hypothetical protein
VSADRGKITVNYDAIDQNALRDYHRKYHPVINGDIKFGFCFGNDETPLTPSPSLPPKMTQSVEKTPHNHR